MVAKTEIIVDQAGNMKVEGIGYSGTACEEVTKKLMVGIKAKSQSEEKKPEYFNRTGTQDKQQQRW